MHQPEGKIKKFSYVSSALMQYNSNITNLNCEVPKGFKYDA